MAGRSQQARVSQEDQGRGLLGSWRVLGVLLLLLSLSVGVQWWLRGNRDPAARPRPPKALSLVKLNARAKPRHESAQRFVRLDAEQTGVDFTNPIDTSHPMKYLYFSGTAGGGVAVGDVDADGLPDIYLVHGPGRNRLYRNLGDFRFADVTEAAGVDGGSAWGTGASLADVNNDGWLDIYVCNYDAPNLLYINQGDGTFREEGERYGVDLSSASMLGSFADYDRDGDLDLYVLTYRYLSPTGRPKHPPIEVVNGRRRIQPPYDKYYRITGDAEGYSTVAQFDWLFRNDGDFFMPVTIDAGLEGGWHGLSATWWDYNQDSWPDLYVANDFMDPDQLYHNNGDGTFTDVIAEVVPNTSWYSMGADIGDIDNDGLIDFLVADMAGRTHFKQKVSMGTMGDSRAFLQSAVPRQYMRNALLINTGTSRMMEAAYLTGLAQTNWTWTVKLADLDNDGRVDAYFTNGSTRNFTDSDIPFSPELLIGRTNWDLYEDSPPLLERNLAFRNRGDFKFDDVSDAWRLDHEGISLAAAHADFDRDGDLDLVVVNFEEPVTIYRNDASYGNGLLVQLEGTQSNRYGIGATVTLTTKSGLQTRYLNPATGFLTSNEPLLHFGLGEDEHAEQLTIDWPSGVRQNLEGVKVGQLVTVVEPTSEVPRRSPATVPGQPNDKTKLDPWFRETDIFAAARHRERPFDDYSLQPLLPNQLSQLGPGMAWGDCDGDGDDDLFLSGAAGQAGTLLLHTGPGKFQQKKAAALKSDRECEDMGAVWFDADGDDDLDLYVASGSYETPEGSPLLQDRLYLNDGRGKLVRAPQSLPEMLTSTGVVAAADFDRDGDLDIFAGGRVVPGKYPLAPKSHLLQNNRGRFVDVAKDLAPSLQQAGMVTSGLWSDVDQDGWIDLLVTYEWGPVRYFHNDHGKLAEATQDAGLAEHSGWFNGLAGGDLDNDGDTDYVVTNVGLNTKYHASAKQPALLYYGDFDGTGRKRLIEAEFEDETLFPVRGKSCSTNAMPHLADRFGTFRKFAVASLEEIYTPNCLSDSLRLEANTLESGILINEGQGRLVFRPLPRLAQISASFGVVLMDIDGDEILDIVLAQNFFGPQPETGRFAGGLGMVLRGHGDGSFTPMSPRESGIVVPQDAKSLTVADLNQDGWLDVVFGINNAAPVAYLHRGLSGDEPPNGGVGDASQQPSHDHAQSGNVGTNSPHQVVETYLGGGYLSQSSAAVQSTQPAEFQRRDVNSSETARMPIDLHANRD